MMRETPSDVISPTLLKIQEEAAALHRDMLSCFDAIDLRFDRLFAQFDEADVEFKAHRRDLAGILRKMRGAAGGSKNLSRNSGDLWMRLGCCEAGHM